MNPNMDEFIICFNIFTEINVYIDMLTNSQFKCEMGVE